MEEMFIFSNLLRIVLVSTLGIGVEVDPLLLFFLLWSLDVGGVLDWEEGGGMTASVPPLLLDLGLNGGICAIVPFPLLLPLLPLLVDGLSWPLSG